MMPDDPTLEPPAPRSSGYQRADNWVVDARLFDATASDDDKALASRALGNAFRSLLVQNLDDRLPLGRICFLDVVTIVPPGLSRGFLLAPETGALTYLELIRTLLDQHQGVADHPVFAAGLPSIADADRVESERELNDLLASLRGKDLESAGLQRSYFVEHVAPPDTSSPGGGSRTGTVDRDEVPFPAEPSSSVLRSFPIVYDSPSRQIARARYGGPDAKISDNLRALRDLFHARREALRSPDGQPLAHVYTVPVATWTLKPAGDVAPLSQGAFFLGLSGPKPLERPVLDAIQGLVSVTLGGAMRSHIDSLMGRRSEAFSFAHQTSKTIDSLLFEAREFGAAIQQKHGFFLGKLHLLRAVVDSYRESLLRADLGDFPYPWAPDECPLRTYRDIGLQLGLARAQDAEEEAVQSVGLYLTESDCQPGAVGFATLIDALFEELPDCGNASTILKHSSFAVLVLLAIQQAVYHTIRSQLRVSRAEPPGKVRIHLAQAQQDSVIVCTVENPEVGDDDSTKTAKDESELGRRAARLSEVGAVTYHTSGPIHDERTHRWVTTIEIRRIVR